MLRFSNILCPLDFDLNSLAAVSVAADAAREHTATVYLLHVLPLPIRETFSFREMETEARTNLERIGHKKLKAGTRYELLVTSGEPAIEILQAATRLGIDLIVMATHGRKGLRRLVLGSVAERVVREAPCPVLTIKPGAARARVSHMKTRPKSILQR